MLPVRVDIAADLRDVDVAGDLLLARQHQVAPEQPDLLTEPVGLAGAVVVPGLAGARRAVGDLVIDDLAVGFPELESFLDPGKKKARRNICALVIWPTSELIGVFMPPSSLGVMSTDWTSSASPLSPLAGAIVYGAPRIGSVRTCSIAEHMPFLANIVFISRASQEP